MVNICCESALHRQAAKEELSRLFQYAGLVHFDIALVGLTEKDLNTAVLETYWDTYYSLNWAKPESAAKTRALMNGDILSQDGEVTVGGAMLFVNTPQKALPQASAVSTGVDKTSDLIDKKEIVGTLGQQVDNTLGLIKLYLTRSSKIENAQRVERELVPEKVLREVLANALVRRDYLISN